MNLTHTVKLLALLAALLCGLPIRSTAAAAESQPDSLQKRRNSLVALPYVYYTPETKFAFGAGSVFSFRSPGAFPNERPSNARVAFTYTQLKQIIIAGKPEVYFRHESYFFGGYYGFYKYPDKFWGIGPDAPDSAEESYESKDFESYTNVQKRVLPGLYIGVREEFRRMNVRKTSPGGLLFPGRILGSRGGVVSGLGFIVNHDTRNHVYQPASGFYNQCYVVFFGKDLGSDFTFQTLNVDLRWYTRVFRSHVIALQTYDAFIWGRPPFQMLSQIGGSYMMRGYYLGRYRDKHMLTVQAEYRFPIWWRLGGVAFAAAGNVAPSIEAFHMESVKYGVGAGIRFLFDARESINARLDVGFGRDGNGGVYAMVLESF